MLELMPELNSKTSDWFRAATLAERIAAGEKAFGKGGFDAELAAKRLQRWRGQASLDGDLVFEQRLAQDNLTEAEFLRLLGETPEGLQARFSAAPQWSAALQEAFTVEVAFENGELPPSRSQNPRLKGFLAPVRPLVAQARRNLREGIAALAREYEVLPFDPANVEELLLEGLDLLLIELLSPTLVLELQVARFDGLLSGSTPEARFDSYLELLEQPDFARKLLQEYPVLTRQVAIILHNRVNFGLEFLGHLCADWPRLSATFSPERTPGVLTALDTNRGDSHRAGRAVLIVRFSSGLKLVYKPRSMAVDVHFQGLLDWLNQRGDHPPFRTLKILNRDSYGWVEFVERATCRSREELERFYERQGAYLAVLYGLGATDFHYGNLIATGEHPVLFDLEALFHPMMVESGQTDADDLAQQVMEYSVLRVNLLPQRIWTNNESVGVEISGLGGEDGQLTSQPLPTWDNVGTDKMRRVYRRLPMPTGKNRPTLNGNKVNPVDYVEQLVSGFTRLYSLLVACREELMAPDGILARFDNDPVRAVMRSTRTYELIQEHSNHPDRLRDALELDCLFDKLWFNVKQRPYLAKVIAAERYDLHQGDVPYFTTRPNSSRVWTSTGQPIDGLLAEPGLELVRQRLQHMGESDLARQLWFIRASLSTFAPGAAHDHIRVKRINRLPATSATRAQLLNEARAIGDRLSELALQSNQEVSWMGLSLERLDHWFLSPLNLTLYDGLPGVALFLAYLGHCTGEEKYTGLARAILPNLRRQIKANRDKPEGVGGLEGWGGVIYSLTHLSALWGDPALLDEALTLVEWLPPLIEKDIYLDFISGVAGCLCSLLALYQYRPEPKVLAAARLCGEKLVASATPQTVGTAWHTHMPASQAAVGLGRGSSGMSYALLKLAAITGEARFRETGLAALAYERSVFRPEANNWPDFRTAGKEPLPEGSFRFMTAWCHGAPGIGLARLKLLDYYHEPEIRAEVETAIKRTLDHGFGYESSLCHGDLGNIDLPLEAAHGLKKPELAELVGRMSQALLENHKERGWVCSNPLLVETPGFMTGLAGIGYGLLRLADPEHVPSILILEPPSLRG